MPSRVDNEFKNRVFELVAKIPKGRVMTYGQLAALAGAPWASWEVGQIAHFAPCTGLPACSAKAGQPADLTAHQSSPSSAAPSKYSNTSQFAARRDKPATPSARTEVCPAHGLPWQRVVNKTGGLARGYTSGGFEAHRRDLEDDGVQVSDDYHVDVDKLLWRPDVDSS